METLTPDNITQIVLALVAAVVTIYTARLSKRDGGTLHEKQNEKIKQLEATLEHERADYFAELNRLRALNKKCLQRVKKLKIKHEQK